MIHALSIANRGLCHIKFWESHIVWNLSQSLNHTLACSICVTLECSCNSSCLKQESHILRKLVERGVKNLVTSLSLRMGISLCGDYVRWCFCWENGHLHWLCFISVHCGVKINALLFMPCCSPAKRGLQFIWKPGGPSESLGKDCPTKFFNEATVKLASFE